VELQRGDRLLFYTDGITEAFDREGELFGEARLDEVCVRHATATPEKIVRGVLEALEDFSKGAAVTDDRTLLVMGVG
jgi:sigma-B regulation protein RsbU (phosphoserine phosphatase)